MAYWGSGPADNDYAFGEISVYVLIIKERMFTDADGCIDEAFPEQAIVATLQCIRLLAGQFHKSVRRSFRRNDFEKAKEAFGRWYESVEKKLPKKYRDAIRSNAEAEFELFEAQVFSPPPAKD